MPKAKMLQIKDVFCRSPEYIRRALTDPQAVRNYILRRRNSLKYPSIYYLTKHLGVTFNNIACFYKHIESNNEFSSKIEKALSKFGKPYYGQIADAKSLYVLCRIVKPRMVAETGVAAGVSSAYILRALEDNNKGQLYSIDLPNYELIYFPKLGLSPVSILPGECAPGFVIPSELRYRWHLKLGRSQEVLQPLLDKLGFIDIFLHDSEHTYKAMTFEYETAWPHISSGGLLPSDNISINNAFKNFSKKVKAKPIQIFATDMGGIIKC